jgi:hypothetical protein
MKGNGDGGIDVGVVEMGQGWVQFRAGIGPSTDFERVPGLLGETMVGWLGAHPGVRVRTALPIVQGGYTVAIHLWYGEE